MKPKRVSWITSYPKSGNTWVRHFLFAYLTGSVSGHRAAPDRVIPPDTLVKGLINERITKMLGGSNIFTRFILRTFGNWPEFVRTNFYDQAFEKIIERNNWSDPIENRVIFKTHEDPQRCLTFGYRTTSAVVLLRNPRDVIISAYKHRTRLGNYHGSAHDYATSFILTGGDPDWDMTKWEEHFSSWLEQARYPVEIIQFEELKVNPEVTFTYLLEALDLKVDLERMERSIKASSLDSLRSMEIVDRTRDGEVISEDTMLFFGTGESGKSLDEAFQSHGLDALFEKHFRPRIDRSLTKLERFRSETGSKRRAIFY